MVAKQSNLFAVGYGLFRSYFSHTRR